MKGIAISILFFIAYSAQTQDHFRVELERMAPDVFSLIKGYEGRPATPIRARDLDGVEHDLLKMRNNGKTTILWFWNIDCIKCHEQIPSINRLMRKYNNQLQIISFASETEDILHQVGIIESIEFPVIPNSLHLSEGPYIGDFGYPKFFILDDLGMVRWVLPEQFMNQNFDTFIVLEKLLLELQEK